MLYVIRETDSKILFRVDAWDIDPDEQARSFIRANGLSVIRDTITANGDWLIYVK